MKFCLIFHEIDLQLMDYVFESHYERHSALHFGAALMLNHAPEKKAGVVKAWNRGIVPSLDSVALRPFTNYLGVVFQSQSNLKPGSEVTFNYGHEGYFEERDVPVDFLKEGESEQGENVRYTVEELDEVGHCLSDVYVNKSNIPMAGKGLFSKKSHVVGSSVSLSPVLVVPKHVLEKAGRSSVIMNFCFSDEGTDLALLPIGIPAMINHNRKPNVAVRWFSWTGDGNGTSKKILSGNLTALLRSSAAPLFFEYYAVRAIDKNEELFMDYGASWEAAWTDYQRAMSVWVDYYGDRGNMLLAPQFRQVITTPRGMLPESVYDVSCFGTRDCEDDYRIRQPKIFHRVMNSEDSTSHLFNYESVSRARNTFNSVKTTEQQTSIDGDLFQIEDDDVCYLYLAPGDFGMGVFSGAPYERGDVLDVSPSMQVSTQALPLLRHVGAPAMRDHYFTVLYGPGAAVKSSDNPNIDRTYDAKDRLRSIPSPQAQATRPYNVFTNMLYFAVSSIDPGEEVLITSGVQRNDEGGEGSRNRMPTYSIEELAKIGHCLTDIYMDNSKIPLAGRGAFSKKHFAAGSTVSVSPAYFVPRHILEDDASSVLINSCLSDEGTDVCILPLGIAGIMNHNADPNVALRWYSPGSKEVDATEMFSRHMVTGGAHPLYLEYYALRPIKGGDELTISYGEDWVSAFDKYLNVLSMWMKSRRGDIDDMMNAPQFRQYIKMPPGIFPSIVYEYGTCLGELGCIGATKLRRPQRIDDKLNREVHTRNIFMKKRDTSSTLSSAESTNTSASVGVGFTLLTSILNIFR